MRLETASGGKSLIVEMKVETPEPTATIIITATASEMERLYSLVSSDVAKRDIGGQVLDVWGAYKRNIV